MIALAVLATACGGADGNDAAPEQDVQIVQVTVQESTYVFSPASVQAEEPVRLVFDPNGLPSCSSSVTLPAYDIAKKIVEGDATIAFTPSASASRTRPSARMHGT